MAIENLKPIQTADGKTEIEFLYNGLLSDIGVNQKITIKEVDLICLVVKYLDGCDKVKGILKSINPLTKEQVDNLIK